MWLTGKQANDEIQVLNETIVHSIPPKETQREIEIDREIKLHKFQNMHTKHTHKYTHDMRAGHWVPSLENWGGGLKSY